VKAAFAGGSALVALILGLSAGLGTERANAAVILPWPTVTSSAHVIRGRAVCTANVRSNVQAGQPVSVRFTLHNASRHSVEFSEGVFGTSLVLRAGDGTTYDSAAPLQGIPVPPPVPHKLRAGRTLRLGIEKVPVRWRGPLQITPECEGRALPKLSVNVTSSWPSPAPGTAISEVAAAAGHLLDHCLPETPGVAVSGQINPPSGSAAPMNAQCSISLSSEGGFLDAQVLVLIPGALSGVQIFEPYELLWPNGGPPAVALTAAPPYEAIAWEFVVTRDKATPVAASTVTASTATGKSAPSFTWNTKGWKSQGAESCGGTGFAWGGTGPDVEFISACSA
jgi:hypothetical protein